MANKDKIKEIVGEWKRPDYETHYTSGDFGRKDWSVYLFAYFDFRANMLVIEDELVFDKIDCTTKEMADGIKKKEKELWTDVNDEFRDPELRMCDTDLQIIADFARLHDLYFIPTKKDNKESQINELRMRISSSTIKINPKCKHLIFHLQNASWNKQRTKFDRLVDGSHADLLDALIYLVRNVNYSKNPFPKDYDIPLGYFKSLKRKEDQDNRFKQALKRVFTPRGFDK
jgi:hypothetical protein